MDLGLGVTPDITPIGLGIIRNENFVGLTPGVIGSGGAVPSYMSVASAAGLTVTVGAGGYSSGVRYFSLQATGTTGDTTGVVLNIDGTQAIPALTGQTWRQSVWMALSAGSMTNVTVLRFQLAERTSAGSFVVGSNSSDFKASLTGTLTQFSGDVALTGGATTAFIQPRITASIGTGLAVDFTLLIGLPAVSLL